MALYQTATDIYHSKISLHDGDTYTHEYRSVLEQIRGTVRRIFPDGVDSTEMASLKADLLVLDKKRKALERKIMAINTDFILILQVVSDGQREDVASRFGILDAETDGVGSLMVFNILGLPGSEAKAVEIALNNR